MYFAPYVLKRVSLSPVVFASKCRKTNRTCGCRSSNGSASRSESFCVPGSYAHINSRLWRCRADCAIVVFSQSALLRDNLAHIWYFGDTPKLNTFLHCKVCLRHCNQHCDLINVLYPEWRLFSPYYYVSTSYGTTLLFGMTDNTL